VYTSFKIRNFRCFQELELDDLALVNLIAGTNNVGKTALLEAMFLHCGAYNPELILRLNAFRGIRTEELSSEYWIEYLLSSLFNQFDISKSIDLMGKDTVTGRRSLRLRAVGKLLELATHRVSVPVPDKSAMGYTKDGLEGGPGGSEVAKVLELEYEDAGKQGKCHMIMDRTGFHTEPFPSPSPFQAFFQDARDPASFSNQAVLYGKLEIHGKQDQVLQALRIIEPRLESVRNVTFSGNPILHGDIGMGHLVPLFMMGDGIVRVANLVLQIGNAPGGVVLVDEIDSGLHYSVMFNVWKAIAFAVRQSNTQIFATTHSWECIKAAHEAFASEEDYDFRLHRLDRIDGEISAVTYNQEALAASLKHELEVR